MPRIYFCTVFIWLRIQLVPTEINDFVRNRSIDVIDYATWRSFTKNQRLFFMTLHGSDIEGYSTDDKITSFSISETNYAKIRSISEPKSNAFVCLTELFIDNAVFALNTWDSFYQNNKPVFPKLSKLYIDTCDFLAVDEVYEEFITLLDKLEDLTVLSLKNCRLENDLQSLALKLSGLLNLRVVEVEYQNFSKLEEIPDNGEKIISAFKLNTHKDLEKISILGLNFNLNETLVGVVNLFNTFNLNQERRKLVIDIGDVPEGTTRDNFAYDDFLTILYFASLGHLNSFLLLLFFDEYRFMEMDILTALCFGKYLNPDLTFGFYGKHNGGLIFFSNWRNFVSVCCIELEIFQRRIVDNVTSFGRKRMEKNYFGIFLLASKDAPITIREKLLKVLKKKGVQELLHA